MSIPNYYEAFRNEALKCHQCHNKGLLDEKARPLFQECLPSGKERVIVVLEAPNHDDTHNPSKGYITCDATTDPTGRFLLRLLEACGLELTDVVLTNSVLCLPQQSNGAYKVKATHVHNCTPLLRHLITKSGIPVVATFGRPALHAVQRQFGQKRLAMSEAVARNIPLTNGVTLLSFFHPSALGRRNRSESAQLQDILALRDILRPTSNR